MEPIFHVIIPSLILIAFFPKISKKMVIISAFIVEFLMDVDSLFGVEWHRILFHNIFWVILIGLGFWLFTKNKEWRNTAWFMAGTHLLFDLRDFGVALFWPLWNKTVSVLITISGANRYLLDVTLKTFDFGELRSAIYPWTLLDNWGAYISIAIAALLLYKHLRKKY